MDELTNVISPVAMPPKDRDDREYLPALPALLAGTTPGQLHERTEKFFLSVAEIFEAWVARRASTHAQRAYRQDVMAFIRLIQIRWPGDATMLFWTLLADDDADDLQADIGASRYAEAGGLLLNRAVDVISLGAAALGISGAR